MAAPPSSCVASSSITAKYSRWKASRSVDSTHTFVAMPVNTRLRMPRARSVLSSVLLKKPL
jgi:hypothetical protein